MSNILNLRIYTPNKLIVDEVISSLTLYGDEGCFTILPKHIDYISSFNDTIMYFSKSNSTISFVALNQGILIKVGREVQISTFNAIFGASSLENLKEKLRESINRDNLKNKIEESLKNIRNSLFNEI